MRTAAFSGCSAVFPHPSDSARMMVACDVCPMGVRQGLFLGVALESLPRLFFTLVGQDVGSSALEGVWE